jgi:hypothetical protein
MERDSDLDVALVRCVELPEPDPDEAPLLAALRRAGLSAGALSWDDPAVDWSRARLTVLRSAWNYPRYAEAFLAWAERAAAVSALWNPLPVVRWNTHKRYLLDLEREGIPIAPTALVPRGASTTLARILDERGWRDAVVKPAVSAASYRTLRVDAARIEAGERHLRALAAGGDALVQGYLPSVEDHGERALVWIDGELTHSVRKSPRWAGESESISAAQEISSAEAELARRAIGAVRGPLLYGRVDAAPGPDGDPVVMELELVEPSLFFPQCPAALDRFVAALRRLLRS